MTSFFQEVMKYTRLFYTAPRNNEIPITPCPEGLHKKSLNSQNRTENHHWIMDPILKIWLGIACISP